ncbi:MAG TPA: sigma-70 family RNA polymerase sigma factor [Candidatus Brocadiia bacterium]|nr:sigma-70 family RNA polymerase sigma factor [Candidatus Brocadiia bacterium]
MKKKLPAALSDLRNQLLYSPDSVREAQMERLEGLIDELDPQQLYPYDYVCFRITNFRPSGNVQATFSGRNLKIDLANLLTELSESYPVPAPENGERILTIEDIGKTYNVSIRTIFRWRKRGLVSRKYVFKGGRIRNGVRESALKCFVDENREKVEKSAKFTKMTPYERKKVIELARKLSAEEKLGLSNMAERIAKEMGRARETIRYTIKAHIEEHPEEELFREVPSVLSDERKRAVYDAYQSGTPVPEICKKFHRKRAAIYRIVNQARAEQILRDEFDYIYSEEFADKNAYEKILEQPKGDGQLRKKGRPRKVGDLSELPVYLQNLYGIPLLGRDEEPKLFRTYNYLKYRICQLRAGLDPQKYVQSQLLNEIDSLKERTLALRNRIIQSNLRLVVSVAKRHATKGVNLFDLISEGNMCLMRAVERFDYTKGNRFSTYATWALMKSFARKVPEEHYQASTFITGQQEMLDSMGADAENAVEDAEFRARMKDRIAGVLDALTEREQEIIKSRYGLDGAAEPRTLAEVGDAFGVTRERIRQIEAGALQKLRGMLSDDDGLGNLN